MTAKNGKTGAPTIERAKSASQQPRFSPVAQKRYVLELIQDPSFLQSLNVPEYAVNSRKRDAWLLEFWRRDTHLAGVLNGAIAIDKNRGWSLTGGRNQVARFTQIMHNWEVAPGLRGWRAGISVGALSYYSTDIGMILELGREGSNGPLRGLYHVDPAQCNLTGDIKYPLAYYPTTGGKRQDWEATDFIRVASMPCAKEARRGLGFCAVSRCIELALIMLAIYQHDREQLGAAAPRGLLLLPGMTRAQWDEAMQARELEKEGRDWEYYSPVAVIAGGDSLDAKLIALSQLPSGFDVDAWTNILMYSYALAFGYDPSEFWPVQFGALGRGTETEVQHEKATGKGGLDFVLGFQEQFSEVLPETLEFDFDERSARADLLEAEIFKAWGEAVTALAVLTPQEARVLLAEHNLIPREWSEIIDDAEATDTQDAAADEDLEHPGDSEPVPAPAGEPPAAQQRRMRDYLLSREAIRRAAETFPGDSVVKYTWPANSFRVLWPSGASLLRRRLWPAVQRAGRVYYQAPDVLIDQSLVDEAIAEAHSAEMVDALRS